MFVRHSARLVRAYCSTPSTSSMSETIAGKLETVDKEMVRDLLNTVPELRKYSAEQWQRMHRLLSAEGLEGEKILSIIGGYPDILVRPSERISDSLHCWRSCQFGDGNTKVLLSAHPQFLDYANHGKLSQRVAFLHSHFETRKNVFRLFLNAPNLLTDEQRAVEEKIDYLMVQMRHEVPDVVMSCSFCHDLEHIRCRHTFLERLGIFKPRSLKAEKGAPTDNPKLHQIVDTSDKRFAVKVAFVTLEEYEVFQELFKREMEGRTDSHHDMHEDEAEELDDNADELGKESYQKSKRKKDRS
ncbi:transcription termination factor 4, mitochondrial [Anopheles bellator]|uniref:transcription termination factor 4, mitochondrial n=1 Tax=Anopheles bellator TaxID=139047 RepID=UPI00264721E6|nr:transcription termination factor 4, mitochondrial [Anopheles bellator]